MAVPLRPNCALNCSVFRFLCQRSSFTPSAAQFHEKLWWVSEWTWEGLSGVRLSVRIRYRPCNCHALFASHERLCRDGQRSVRPNVLNWKIGRRNFMKFDMFVVPLTLIRINIFFFFTFVQFVSRLGGTNI